MPVMPMRSGSMSLRASSNSMADLPALTKLSSVQTMLREILASFWPGPSNVRTAIPRSRNLSLGLVTSISL